MLSRTTKFFWIGNPIENVMCYDKKRRKICARTIIWGPIEERRVELLHIIENVSNVKL